MKDPEIAEKIRDGGFILREDGRCPFLRDDGLCEMIIKHGEDYLCDICKEHPRFYNEADGHIEGGFGMVCEAACELILGREHGFELVADDGSKIEQPEYLKIIFDESKPLTERLFELSEGKRAGSKLRAEIFDGMEVLDHKWTKLLKKIIDAPISEEDEDKAVNANSKALANFAGYLLYRYQGAGRFAAEATYLVADLAAKGCGITEIARVFSGEVEYSDINIVEALETFS
jgi:lysine-N-methylase